MIGDQLEAAASAEATPKSFASRQARQVMFDLKVKKTEKAEAGDKMRSFAGSPFQKVAGFFDFCRETFLIRKGELVFARQNLVR